METANLFKQDAKIITDTLFEAKMFRDDLTRDELNTIEDLIGDLMSSRFNSLLRAEKLFKQIENKQ